MNLSAVRQPCHRACLLHSPAPDPGAGIGGEAAGGCPKATHEVFWPDGRHLTAAAVSPPENQENVAVTLEAMSIIGGRLDDVLPIASIAQSPTSICRLARDLRPRGP